MTLNDDYDRFGNRNLLTLTDSSGISTHQYNYNKLNRLTTAVLPGSQTLAFTYYANEQIKQLQHPNNLITDYLYKANGPVNDIKISANTTVLEQLSYAYDKVRNVDTLADSKGLHDYNYDNLYRLTQAIHPTGSATPALETYAYDNAGNREDPVDATLYNYDSNNRITKSPSVTSYVFDDDGNMTSNSSSETFTYNHANRLTNYSKTGTAASYLYDPFGKRLSKTVNGITTWYLWDRNKLLTEYNNSGVQQKRYAYLPNQYTPIQVADSNGIYTVHKNHLGVPLLLTDSTKNIVWSAETESFGQAVVNNDVDGNGTAVVFNHRLPGQYLDLESGLSYNRFRYYSSSLGRYITSDPIGLDGGLNTYSYVRNNPLRFIDPYGLAETISSFQNNVSTGPGGIGSGTDSINPGVSTDASGPPDFTPGIEATTACVVMCNNGDIVVSPQFSQDFYGDDARNQYLKWLKWLNDNVPPESFCPGG